jgi:hypothetical protein
VGGLTGAADNKLMGALVGIVTGDAVGGGNGTLVGVLTFVGQLPSMKTKLIRNSRAKHTRDNA